MRSTAPRVKAADADGLRKELKDLKHYFNECKLNDRHAWFRTLRSLADGNAATELEHRIVHDIGGEESYQRALLKAGQQF